MYKVLITGSELKYKKDEIEVLKDLAEVIIDDTWKKDEIIKIIPDIDGLLVDVGVDIDKDIIEKANKLKIIVVYGTGINNIDIDAATVRKIRVCNLPDVYKNEVAEFAVCLILCLSKEVIRENNDLKKNFEWNQGKYNPQLILNKTIGLIGFGRIARRVKEIMQGFNVKFLAYDPYINKDFTNEKDVKFVTLESLLRNSDFISIHIPLTKNNENFIDLNKMKLMKKSAFLINISRGRIINENDLYIALKEKIINGAAIDVFETEPVDKANPLLKLNNVIVTPHIAWKSEKSEKRCEMLAANKIKDFFSGKDINDIVNLEKL